MNQYKRTSILPVVAITAIVTILSITGNARAATPPIAAPVVNINTATPAQLALLPGIGAKLAAGIIAARPFARVEDLVRVKGIKVRKLATMRAYVVVSGATTARVKIHTVKAGAAMPTTGKPIATGTRCGHGVRCGGAQ